MFARFLLTILVTAFLSFGQEQGTLLISEELPNTIINTDSVGATAPGRPQNIEETKPEVSIEKIQGKVKNPRYVVISAIGMMLFVGLAMVSVSAINPD